MKIFSSKVSIATRTRKIAKKGLNINPHEEACKTELIGNPTRKMQDKIKCKLARGRWNYPKLE
jgi:hypothetical protein